MDSVTLTERIKKGEFTPEEQQALVTELFARLSVLKESDRDRYLYVLRGIDEILRQFEQKLSAIVRT